MGRGDKPGQDEWSQGRRAASETPGYAPRPLGQATPKPLKTTLVPGPLKPKWTPNAGWKPARWQNASIRASIYGARAVNDAGTAAFNKKLMETSKNSMGPLAGGGDPKSQKKR
jgi:hypothetical protein